MPEYKLSQEYLNSFINYENKSFFPYKKSLKLTRVFNLLEVLGIDFNKLKTIHIAGTKGKGSTATFCAEILAASGYKIGLYTSPHMLDFRERIQIVRPRTLGTGHRTKNKKIKKQLIPKKDIVKIINEFKPVLEKLKRDEKHGSPTFFEVYTAIALKYFIEQKCDFVVLETGLGGRLDATNVIKPLVSIITHVGYDHTDKLGSKLSQIAFEKAGIVKKGVCVVTSWQRKDALLEIKRKCRETESKLFIFRKDFLAKNIRFNHESTDFDFVFNKQRLTGLKIFLKGKCQIENVSLALAAIYLLKEQGALKNEINFKQGLKNSFLEGRFEVVNKNPLVVMDIAHNPSSFLALKENLKIYFPGKKIILIFAASQDKNVNKMLKVFPYQNIILTRFDNPRAFNQLEIKDLCKLKNPFITETIKEAFMLAKKLYNSKALILISGSLFLVAQAKRMVKY